MFDDEKKVSRMMVEEKKIMSKSRVNLGSFFRGMVYILPALLFFSYYPLIHFGSSESMNFEVSLPLIWLVLFDILSFIILLKRKMLKGILKKWVWLLFPIFLSLSVLWSLNSLRGLFTVGILWLLYFAIYSLFSLKSLFSDDGVKEVFWKWFFLSAILICFWCFLQCILDLTGVNRGYSLMCAGCTYTMFGFPHPNGFSIEPQFMGNLLLAPGLVAGFWFIKTKVNSANSVLKKIGENEKVKFYDRPLLWGILYFIFVATLFLTFSRGAIYSFIVATIFLTVFEFVRMKNWRAMVLWPIIVLAFLFTLNLQGVFSEISKTNDTYMNGVTKVIDHMTLGIVDFTEDNEELGNNEALENNEGLKGDEDMGGSEGSEGNEKLSEEIGNEKGTTEDESSAVFDGYVEESTNARLKLTDSALKVWSKDFMTMMFGVGIGGAGQSLYVNGLTETPKEIVQNQYASLLLEIGIVGILLFILSLVLVIRVVSKSSMEILVLALMIGYGISLCFFSGLPNALQIYLLPGVIMVVGVATLS